MRKPFQGVISQWQVEDQRIHGICLYHATYENGITQNQLMWTSPIVAITEVMLCGVVTGHIVETRNSYYYLVDRKKEQP